MKKDYIETYICKRIWDYRFKVDIKRSTVFRYFEKSIMLIDGDQNSPFTTNFRLYIPKLHVHNKDS
jgi:hypothetical protein